MPFMKGKAPIRRTLQYLEAGKLVLRDHIKIVTIIHMETIIKEQVLGKSLHTLAKIDDEIYFEAQENPVVLSWMVQIIAPVFLSNTTFDNIEEDLSKTDTPAVAAIGVKIRAKPLCMAFKCISLLDKNLETCTIPLESNPTKIKFNFEYKNKICRLVNIWLMDSDESLEVGSLNCSECHKITSWSTTFSHALANFRRTDSDITFIAAPSKLVLRNYMDSDDVKLNAVRSQVSLSSNEFDTYQILEDATVTFPLRAFRAAVQFADTFNRLISVFFKEPGKSVEVQFSNNTTFQAKFIMATMYQPLSLTGTTTTASPVFLDQNISPESTQSIDLLAGYNSQMNPFKKTIHTEPAPKIVNDVECVDLCEDKEDPESLRLFIPASPDTSTQMRFLFKRCLEPTFNRYLPTDEEVYAENSDPECEAILYDV